MLRQPSEPEAQSRQKPLLHDRSMANDAALNRLSNVEIQGRHRALRFTDNDEVGDVAEGPKVVAHLSRCHEGHCLSLAAGSNYAATAALGLRSLASYALPRS